MFSILVQFYPSNYDICGNECITLESMAAYLVYIVHSRGVKLFQSLKKTLPVTLNTNPSESKTRKPAVWSLHSGHHQQLPRFCSFDRFFCSTCIKALCENDSMILERN